MVANKWARPESRSKRIRPRGSGRKPGGRNKFTLGKLALKGEYSSLTFLQAVYRNVLAPGELRMRAAVAAIPYEHPALRSVDFKGSMTVGISAALQQFIA